LREVPLGDPEQIKNRIKGVLGDVIMGGLPYLRFRVEGDSQARPNDHRKVVGAVSDGDSPVKGESSLIGDFFQEAGHSIPIDDRSRSFPCKLSHPDFQSLGIGMVDVQLFLDPVGKTLPPPGRRAGFPL
jgi:hypothetical protein